MRRLVVNKLFSFIYYVDVPNSVLYIVAIYDARRNPDLLDSYRCPYPFPFPFPEMPKSRPRAPDLAPGHPSEDFDNRLSPPIRTSKLVT